MPRTGTTKKSKATPRQPDVGRQRSRRNSADADKPKHGPGKKSAKATRSRRTLVGKEPTRRTAATRTRTSVGARSARTGPRQSRNG